MKIDREHLSRLSRRAARRLGWHLVRADAYSPVVDAEALAPDAFTQAAPMPGLELDLDGQVERLQALEPQLRSWHPPRDPPGDDWGFHLHNPYYGPLDAELLHSMLRRHRPTRVLELGSGYSSLVIAAAAADNRDEGHPLEHTIVDPGMSALTERLAGARRLRTPAQSLDASEFETLGAGDVLFVDTSHAVRAGGEVVRIVLEVLPRLSFGVIVHFHDVFRPFEYPRVLFEHYNLHWQEQYLLQAFLAFNQNFNVLFAAHALARLRTEPVRALVPSLTPRNAPSAFWIERVDPAQRASSR